MNAPDIGGAAPPGPSIAVLADLIFGARIRAAAAAHGIATLVSTAPDRVVQAVRQGAATAFIDLDTHTTDPVALIARLRAAGTAHPVRIVAFASHVRTDLIDGARQAGADRVLPRGAFARLLHRLVADPGAER